MRSHDVDGKTRGRVRRCTKGLAHSLVRYNFRPVARNDHSRQRVFRELSIAVTVGERERERERER